MKIGFVMDVYHGYTSGVTTYVSSLRRYFEKNNHEVFIFCFGSRETGSSGAHIIQSPGIRIKGSYYIGARFSRQAREFLQKMDVLHLQHPFVSGPLAINNTQTQNMPFVFTNHTRYDLYMQYYAPFFPNNIGMWLLKTSLKSFFRQVDAIVAPSKGIIKVLLEFGVKSNLYHIFNGIDLENFYQIFHKRKVSGQHSSNRKGCTLIYVGRLGKEKNLLLLLKVFKRIHQIEPATRLILVGDGPDRSNLERFIISNDIQSAVKITGFVPYSRIPEYLYHADFFMTASVTEVHPLTIIEAMSTGLPVVAIRSTGIEDTVLHEETGLLSEEQEEDNLVNLALELIQNKEKRLWMGEKGAERAKLFSLETCGDSLLNLYNKVLTQKRRVL